MTLQGDKTVLLQDQQLGHSRWLCFRSPLEIIQTGSPEAVMGCLQQVEERVESGLYAAGFIGYEASSGLDPALQTHLPTGIPCLWFGIFAGYEEVDPPGANGDDLFSLDEWIPSISWEQYNGAIEKIRRHIREGDTYQVNYTFRLRSKFKGDSFRLFTRLFHAQQSRYAAFIDLGRYKICSVSPEIFMSLNGETILSRPMKGTILRGYTNLQDKKNVQWLYTSEKNRAENLMIVDMVRNDIGKVAQSGTVRVPKLFEIEKYPTVHQMTSTVTADTSAPVSEILKAMFPCASITGAPKVKTMQIIRELEPDPRGIYTGSIGYIAPGRKLQFNVAIRTVVLDMERGTAEYGVGGGITWGSESRSEYVECAAKAKVLTHVRPEFELLESILWDPEIGYYLLDEHLCRLHDSAEYFDFQVPLPVIQRRLQQLRSGLGKTRHKVRLLLSRKGAITLDASPVNSIVGSCVWLSKVPVKTNTPFVFHKTSNRKGYSEVMVANGKEGDLFLWNEDGFVTETTIANVVIDSGNGSLVTPPVSCGLLAGVQRALLLKSGVVAERVVSLDELKSAANVYLVNSVRGWMRLSRKNEDAWIVVDEQCYESTPDVKTSGCGFTY